LEKHFRKDARQQGDRRISASRIDLKFRGAAKVSVEPTSPAMAAGVSDRLWEIGDIVKLVEDAEPKPSKRGLYKKA